MKRRGSNPLPRQKPFPYGVNGDACNSTVTNDIAVPDWYIAGKVVTNQDLVYNLTDAQIAAIQHDILNN
jgi:hypothetical protein